MTDINEVKTEVTEKVEKVVGWRDRYLQWISAHPKTVALILPIAVIWAILSSL